MTATVNRGSSSRSRRRRLARASAGLFLTLAVVCLGGCVWSYRDRHPGYGLQLDVPGPALLSSTSSTLRVGFGRVKINPDLSNPDEPIYIAGFGQNRIATAIHDDLWAVACVFDDGTTRLGIAALDAIGFFHDDVIRVRQKFEPDWELDYTVICSTHSHSTPDLLGLWGPNYLKTGVNRSYRGQVIEATARAFGLAVDDLRPARVALHEIATPSEGLVGDSRKPVVFDPNIRLMHFTNPTNGLTIGSLVTWADHPETVWRECTDITADFPGYLRSALESGVEISDVLLEPGLGGTHLYINGAIGGLMSTGPGITVRDPYLQQDFTEPTHDKARALGRNLASRILRRLDETNAPLFEHPRLRVKARTLELPLDNMGYLIAPVLGLIDRGHVEWKRVRTEVALITFGEASIACIPGEIYPEIVNGGIERAPGGDFDIDPVEEPPIRDMMPGEIKFVFGLANDEIGYIIPKSEWDRKKPYLYGSEKRIYGEINSCGPEIAPLLHRAFRDLCP